MRINWEEFREHELNTWKSEVEEEIKHIEREMIKQQKRREKMNLRFSIAQEVERELQAGAKFLLPYQKKREQVSEEVNEQLKGLLEKYNELETFKKMIRKTIEGEIHSFPEPLPINKKKKLKRKLPQKV